MDQAVAGLVPGGGNPGGQTHGSKFCCRVQHRNHLCAQRDRSDAVCCCGGGHYFRVVHHDVGLDVNDVLGCCVKNPVHQGFHDRTVVQQRLQRGDPLVRNDLGDSARQHHIRVRGCRICRQVQRVGKKHFVARGGRFQSEGAEGFVISTRPQCRQKNFHLLTVEPSSDIGSFARVLLPSLCSSTEEQFRPKETVGGSNPSRGTFGG